MKAEQIKERFTKNAEDFDSIMVDVLASLDSMHSELAAIHAIAMSPTDSDTTEQEGDTLTLKLVKRMACVIQEQSARMEKLREAVANYMDSEGCRCCQDIEAHEKHEKRLAELLNVPTHPSGSGYDFYQFRTNADEA